MVKNLNKPVEILGDGVETVTKFPYLADRPNASSRCEPAVTARTRIVWMKVLEMW